jgi:hypothetical protein
LKAAEELCPRINTKRTTSAIENEMKAIEAQIQMSEKLYNLNKIIFFWSFE